MNQHDHMGRAAGDAPIYATLVQERGDVPADVRQAAARLLEEADRAVDFSSLRAVA
ncbi:hypothetical protein J7E93_00595 [Streptomyces sp. ISL-36]|uniref:hypothetical protein n=1 Tax=Streptomyces sp. ISL-36 TaxID=2819182 RepID=UPI001BE4F0BC|nr:hypothetical protein [Streptomyces sp. ISL-36]MBT2438648.1 hypothetical protein [Streptomyces sp. ISL-36]